MFARNDSRDRKNSEKLLLGPRTIKFASTRNKGWSSNKNHLPGEFDSLRKILNLIKFSSAEFIKSSIITVMVENARIPRDLE